MARSFSEREKGAIQKGLIAACQESWAQHGYKKTSVEELCKRAGISKGAFYLFFPSKESLFCEVLCSVQEQVLEAAGQAVEQRRDKSGILEAMKLIYQEYAKNSFLCHAGSGDYTALQNKLSEEQLGRLAALEERGKQLFLGQPHLELKVSQGLAVSAIYSLLMNVRNKDVLPCGHVEVFGFLAECLVEKLYQ